MPGTRDRLQRQVDPAELYTLRFRRTNGGLEIFMDEPERGFGNQIRRRLIAAMTTGQMGVAARRAGTVGRGRGSGSPAAGRENTLVIGRGTGLQVQPRLWNNSVLPIWYPRSPLHDVTAVVRATERRGTPLRGIEGLEIGSPIVPWGQIVHTPSVLRSAAQLEHAFSHTPKPTIGKKHCPPSTVGKVPKILLDITSQNNGDSEFLTPQEKLLNFIDKVEKVVIEELRKLKRTPSAKKAEREKKVRILMSMR